MPNLYERQCILGVKINGTTFILTTLNEGDDQSSYDYIVNTSNSSFHNGNGTFSISILNKDFEKGLPINNWILQEGRIGFNWGSSSAYFTLVDKLGEKTKEIFANSGSGSAAGFSIENLTRSIFPKARDIVAEYPSARIYNLIEDFKSQTKKLKEFQKERIKEEIDSAKSIREYEDKFLIPLKDCFQSYKELKSLLSNQDDIRSQRLFEKITLDFRKEIQNLFD